MFAEIIIDQDAKALDRVFEYKIPEDMTICVGMRVYIPFSSRMVQGFVVGIKETCNYEESKIKEIRSKIEETPAIKGEMLQLMKFMADKNHLKLASILRLFLPAEMREGRVKELFKTYYSLVDGIEVKLSKSAKKQQEILDELQNGRVSAAQLGDKFGYSALKALLEKGYIKKESEEIKRSPFVVMQEDRRVNLNEGQREAIKTICENKTYLLHSFIGSCRT